MEYQLREYQEKAVEAVLQGFRDGQQKLLVKMAVGTGHLSVLAGLLQRLLQDAPQQKILLLTSRLAMKHQIDSMLHQLGIPCATQDYHAAPIYLSTYAEYRAACEKRSAPYFRYVICEEAAEVSDAKLEYSFANSFSVGFTNRPEITQGYFAGAVCAFCYSLNDALLDGYFKPESETQYAVALEGFGKRFLQQFGDVTLAAAQQPAGEYLVTAGQSRLLVECKSYRTRSIPLQILDKAVSQMQIRIKNTSQASGLLLLLGEVPEEYKKACYHRNSIAIWDIANILYYVKDLPELFEDLANLAYFPIADTDPLPPYGWKPSTRLYRDAVAVIPHNFETRLRECGAGKRHAQAYEEICGDILRYLFGEEFSLYSSQHKTGDELFRMDVLCALKGTSAFWNLLIQHYNTRFVVFEFKNYAVPLPQNLIFVTEKYLFNAALRNVAIIISRYGFSKHAAAASEGCLKESGKLMIDVTDEDLIAMLRKKESGEEPADYLLEKLERMLMSIGK